VYCLISEDGVAVGHGDGKGVDVVDVVGCPPVLSVAVVAGLQGDGDTV